jgi:hypothetical protein
MALLIRLRAVASAAVMAVLAAGCEFIRPPTFVPADPDQLLVHAVLVAESDSAAVLVTRVGSGHNGQPVSGAQVRLIGEHGQAVLAEVVGDGVPCWPHVIPPEARTGCYVAALSASVRAGAEYRLEVDIPGGEQVRGRTVVPAPATMLAPEDRLRIESESVTAGHLRGLQSVLVRWSVPGPVTLAGWVERGWAPERDDLRCGTTLQRPYSPQRPELETDSAWVGIEVYSCTSVMDPTVPLRADSVEVTLGVTTYDASYLAYVEDAENGLSREQASRGLEGAFGVFGSAATARRRVILVAREDDGANVPGD